MTRRRLPLMLAVVGVLVILAAIVAASFARSSDTAVLALPERPEQPVVVTEPGVLDAVDPTVTVRATADDDEPVVLAIGRTPEVEAWLGDADHARVTGLSSWEELTVEVVTGDPEQTTDGAAAEPSDGAPAAPTDGAAEPTEGAAAEPTEGAAAEPGAVPDPAGSDLWVVETSSTGSAELSWTDAPGRWSLVAATDGTGPAPVVELEWGRQLSMPWLVPAIVLGALMLLAGGVLMVLGARTAREQRRRVAVVRSSVREPSGTGATGAYPVSVTDDPGTSERLSRRQIRQMERAMARADRRRAAGEEVAPPTPSAEPAADDAASDDDTPPPSSWRSVWGFRAPPARPAPDDEATEGTDDEGGERR